MTVILEPGRALSRPKPVSGMFCSAGSNYFVLAPNGDAFSCMTDLEANRKPAFNAHRDGWSPREVVYRCSHPTCSGCDYPYVARWIQDAAGAAIEEFPREWPLKNYQITDRRETLDDLSGDVKSLTWLPSQICNYTCVYCDYGNGKAFTHERYPMSKKELSVEEWIRVWESILDHVAYAAVSISGGEPTMSGALFPVVEMISQRYIVNLTTNGSQNLLRMIRQARKKHSYTHPRLGPLVAGVDQINFSLHPTSRTFDEPTFKGNVLMAKHGGFNPMVNFVGYPAQLYLAPEYARWCADHDVPFMLLEWGTGDRFGNAASYTKEERDFFDAHVAHDRRVNAPDTIAASHRIELKPTAPRASRNEQLAVTGSVTNTTDEVWSQSGPVGVFVGARLYPSQHGEEGWRAHLARRTKPPLKELRSPLPSGRLAPAADAEFGFVLDCAGLDPGRYDLVVDVVDEGKYWFGSVGATPVTVSFSVV